MIVNNEDFISLLSLIFIDSAQKCVATVFEDNGIVEKYTGCIEKNITQYCGMNVDLTAHDIPIKMKVKELFWMDLISHILFV